MRSSALRSALGGVVLSLVAAMFAAVTTAPASGAREDTAYLGVGTYNIRAGVSMTDFKGAIAALKSDPRFSVVGLQEIGSNERNKFLREDLDWGYHRPPQLQQNPVIWRREYFDLLSVGGFKIANARNLGDEYKGTGAKDDSWATIVRLRDRLSGEQVSFINVHFVRGAVKGGLPAKGKPRLFDLYADQVAGTKRAIKSERERSDIERVVVLGDLNVGYKADLKRKHKKLPYRQWTPLGMKSMWHNSPVLQTSQGTKNDALIDQVWTTSAPVDTEVLTSIRVSDHFPALAMYARRAAEPGYKPVEGTVGFGDVRLIPNGNRPGDTENNGPSKLPSMFIPLEGDLKHGHVRIEVVTGEGRGFAQLSHDGNEPGDFAIDTSTLYDNVFGNEEIAIDIVGDRLVEGDETFTLRLVRPVNTRIVPQAEEIVLTIKDDD